MKTLKNAWAQIVCVVVLILALGWAGYTVFQSGIDDDHERVDYRSSLAEIQKNEDLNDPRRSKVITVTPTMLSSVPQSAPVTPVSAPTRNFFPSGYPSTYTPVATPAPETNTQRPVPPDAVVTDIKLPAYVRPGILEVYQLNTGNYLVVVLPWERSMMTVTGFAIQRMEMLRTVNGEWKSKTNQWVNLPKYTVMDESKAGMPPPPAGAPAPAAAPAPAPTAPRGLLGGGAAPAPTAGGGLLGGGATPSASGFDLKKYQGIYVLFDRVAQAPDVRFDYRLVIVAKPNAEAVNKQAVGADGRPVNIQIVHPTVLSTPYAASGVNLQVFAPGPVVQPTFTGKVQVKFVSVNEDKSIGSFIVMRGQASSKIVEIPVGEEIIAELPVLDEKGRPVVGEGGNAKENVSTGLVFTAADTNADTKKTTVVLTDAKKQEVLIEQGKTNGDPKAPEIDLSLLNKIQTEREKEYKAAYKTTPDKGDTTYTVPAKDFAAATAELEGGVDSLVPNDFYPTPDDETTPPSPLPQLTLSPRPVVPLRPRTPPKAVAPVVTAPVRPIVAPPPPAAHQPPESGRGYGDVPDQPVNQEPDKAHRDFEKEP